MLTREQNNAIFGPAIHVFRLKPLSSSRMPELRRTSGRSRGSTGAKIARKSWSLRVGMAGTKLDVSSWVAVKTIRRFTSGWRPQPGHRDSSVSPWGRTVFWEPLVEMRDKKILLDAAVDEVAPPLSGVGGYL